MTTRLAKRCNSTGPIGYRPHSRKSPERPLGEVGQAIALCGLSSLAEGQARGDRRQKPIVCPTSLQSRDFHLYFCAPRAHRKQVGNPPHIKTAVKFGGPQ